MSIDQVSKSSVLIAGADIGGLAMALLLLPRDIDCDLLELARRHPGRYREQICRRDVDAGPIEKLRALLHDYTKDQRT